MYATIVSSEMATPAFVDRRAFQCSPIRDCKGRLAPLPEREAAHLGDAIAGPRTLLFSSRRRRQKGELENPVVDRVQRVHLTLNDEVGSTQHNPLSLHDFLFFYLKFVIC